MWRRLRITWRALRQRQNWEDGLEEELRQHRELRAAELVRGGLSPEEAARRARLEIGTRETYKEDCREAHGLRWPDELRQDLRYAARSLLHSPGFTAVALLSLALGLGANTVVFSIFYSLVVKSLPLPSPEQLFFVQGRRFPSQSFPNYRDLRDRNTTFRGLAGYRVAQMGIETNQGAQRVFGYLATGNYFDVLGVEPALGRFFRPDEDVKPGASPYAVLSYSCWQDRFAGDRQIVGKTVRINTLPYTVLGVTPKGFQGTELFYWPEIWVPMMMLPEIEGRSWLESRDTFNLWITGRLKPGVTRAQAESNLNAIAGDLARDFPKSNEGMKLQLAHPGMLGDTLGGPMRAFTGGVLILAGLVLLAACVNLASLLSARAADRARELAIRLSLGASRGRVVRQLLTESMLLALLGGAGGCVLAAVLLRLVTHWRAPLDFPIQLDVNPDPRVFGFALIASLLTGLLFGITPARQAWRTAPQQSLKGEQSFRAGRRWAFRDVLLVLQVTLCCLLVTGCFVALRGLWRTSAMRLGFEPQGVTVVGFDLTLARYSEANAQTFQRRALEAVAHLPGVTSASLSNSVPLSIDQSSSTVFSEQSTDRRLSQSKTARRYQVSPGYFETMGTRLIAGRDISWHDDPKAPPVAVVNQAFARQVLGTTDTDAVGRRFVEGSAGTPVEIVGLVEDGKYQSLTEDPAPAMFFPVLQSFNPTTMLEIRSSRPQGEMAAALRQTLMGMDPSLPLYGLGSLHQMLGFVFFPSRAATILLGAFGVLAVMLAVTGIYGLAAYTVSRRVREIGIRVAIGARPWQVLRFVLGRTALLLAAGSCLGLGLGFAASQALASIVYQATARDPEVLAAVPLAMILIGLASTWVPARRTLSLDPIRALRQD